MRPHIFASGEATGNGMRNIIMARRGPAFLTPAYANTLTALIPQIYAAMDVVARELVGFIPSSMRAPGVERAAVGQSVTYPISLPNVAFDIAPSMQVPEPPDNAVSVGSMAITKSRAVPFGFTGEEQVALGQGGPGYLSVQGMWIAQALRTLCNEVEGDLAAEAAANASRAYGTSGTTPFATDSLMDIAQLRKILDDNGASPARSLILNTSAGANMRGNVKHLTRANEAATQMTLRQGELLDVFGMSIKESAANVYHAKGTATGVTTNTAGYAVGARQITINTAGTGAILPGDWIQIAGDGNKYVVAPGGGIANVANGGAITIAEPGIRIAVPAAAAAIGVGGSYAANVAFSLDALHIAMRPPARPKEGDLASDVLVVTDPFSGISFEFSIYPGYRKIRGEVALAWGVKATKREMIALLVG